MARVRMNKQGFEKILRHAKVEEILRKHADEIAAYANALDNHKPGEPDGYIAAVKEGKSRSRGSVVTGTQAAKADNAKNNTLIKALGGG